MPKGKKQEPKPVSVEGVEIDRAPLGKQAELEAKVAELEKELALERGIRAKTEADALQLAESQGMLMQREIREVPTGNYRMVEVQESLYVKSHRPDDGRPILAAKMKKTRVPTFFYKIDLPPIGGMDIKINGQSFMHGAVYEFDLHQLRSVKDTVAKCWAHDRQIHGDHDENAYRKPTRPVLRMR